MRRSLAVRALPVVHAARRHAREVLVDPEFLAVRRVERDDRAVPSLHVGDTARDDRARARRPERVEPDWVEIAHVAAGEIAEREKVGAVRSDPERPDADGTATVRRRGRQTRPRRTDAAARTGQRMSPTVERPLLPPASTVRRSSRAAGGQQWPYGPPRRRPAQRGFPFGPIHV